MSPITIDLGKFPGKHNDYRHFLAWLARHFPPDALFVECGTHNGHGANSLGSHGNHVDTYDINVYDRSCLRPNVHAHILDLFEIPHKVLTDAALIYLDIDWHTGYTETLFYNKLKTIGYQGLLVCDDIYLDKNFTPRHCPEYEHSDMPKFWNAIDLPKLDTGTVAHESGMGLVSFSPDIILKAATTP
jgi:hypothetical protein